MNEYLKSLVGELLETSGFVASLRELKRAQGKSRLFGDRVRLLTAGEIDALKSRGNHSPDWGRVLVAEGFTPALSPAAPFSVIACSACSEAKRFPWRRRRRSRVESTTARS